MQFKKVNTEKEFKNNLFSEITVISHNIKDYLYNMFLLQFENTSDFWYYDIKNDYFYTYLPTKIFELKEKKLIYLDYGKYKLLGKYVKWNIEKPNINL